MFSFTPNFNAFKTSNSFIDETQFKHKTLKKKNYSDAKKLGLIISPNFCPKHNVKKMVYGNALKEGTVLLCPICQHQSQASREKANRNKEIKRKISQLRLEIKSLQSSIMSVTPKEPSQDVIDYTIAQEIASRREYGCEIYGGDRLPPTKNINGGN